MSTTGTCNGTSEAASKPPPPYASTTGPNDPLSASAPAMVRTARTKSSAACGLDWKKAPMEIPKSCVSMRSEIRASSPSTSTASRPLMSSSNPYTSAPTTPVDTLQRNTTSASEPGSEVKCDNASLSSGCATKQLLMATTSWLERARKPGLPSASTATRIVVREPTGSTVPKRMMFSTSAASLNTFPVRASDSATMRTFASYCPSGDRCCHEHPPQPSATCGHGGSRRSGDGDSISSTVARPKSLRVSVSCTRTTSPGSAPSTKITLPLGRRARASPPATSC